ncbi:hypothetical protein JCM4814A_81210 [Streptomyces phaeofaciens JCM 4814]|uniref:Uncharacterized protein n=1 Tax=Streptomyces phaeofaciens TaxID=68254 RepID=A0A918HRI2_9ACTN|nr:hypothetical protein GCM10010226_90750 [Streptomyces phaeofaciens]
MRGVDQRDTQLDGPPGDRERGFAAPARFRRQVHGPEAQPPYFQIPADTKRSRCHALSSPLTQAATLTVRLATASVYQQRSATDQASSYLIADVGAELGVSRARAQ